MRRPLSHPDPTQYGEYLTSINPKLNAYIRAHCPITEVDGWESRRHLQHDELVELHEEAGCRWWHRGSGIVTTGQWVESPSRRISEE